MEPLKGRIMKWQSSICNCSAITNIDGIQRRQIKCCSYNCVIWCNLVSQEVFAKRISQIPVIRQKDIEEVKKMLVWKDEFSFFRPTISYARNGITAYQAYQDWDGRGIGMEQAGKEIPIDECEEPELLADLVQAKRCREFTIDQWVETYKLKDEYIIWPEEYLEHPGMNWNLFKTLFKRNPTAEIIGAIENILYPELKYKNYELTDYLYYPVGKSKYPLPIGHEGPILEFDVRVLIKKTYNKKRS